MAGVTAGLIVVGGVVVTAMQADGGHRAASFTFANAITVTRGAILALAGGFLFVSPSGAVVQWFPAALFGLAAGLDVVDGRVARARGAASAVGHRLDEGMDTLVVLVGSLLVVSAGLAHLTFLAAGVAKYVFTAGIAWREYRRRPVVRLDHHPRRKAIAALLLLSIWVALFPVTGEPMARWVTGVAVVPFLLHFARDWLVVSDRL